MKNNSTFVPYAEQIKSPKWQKKRLEILQLHNFKCEECGSETKTLNVHHRFYIKGREIHEYDNDVLQCLCEDCHAKAHNKVNNEYKDGIKIDEYFAITSEIRDIPLDSVAMDIIKKIIDYHEFTNFAIPIINREGQRISGQIKD